MPVFDKSEKDFSAGFMANNPLPKLASKNAMAYKKEMGTHPLKQTYSDASKITGKGREVVEYTSQEDVKPVVHASGKEYGTTLYSYYKGKGMDLPSKQERAKIYESQGLGLATDYTGTREQNKALFNTLTTTEHKDIYRGGDLYKTHKTGVGPMGGKQYSKDRFSLKTGDLKRSVDIKGGEKTVEGPGSRIGDFFRGLGDRMREGKTREGKRRTISYDEAGNKVITVTDRKGTKKKQIKKTEDAYGKYRDKTRYDKEGNVKKDVTLRTDHSGNISRDVWARKGKYL
mgnify:FL=1